MKCTNPKCELISLVPEAKCPECGSEMKRIIRKNDEVKVVDESVNTVDSALVLSAEIELEEESNE